MSKFNRKPIVLVLLISILAILLAACSTSAKITGIEVLDTEYKTLYVIGEELDTYGMVLRVKYDNDTYEDYDFSKIKNDIAILNFDTRTEKEMYEVKMSYGKLQTSFFITVVSEGNSRIMCDVRFETGEGSAVDPIQVAMLDNIPEPVAPTRDGYYFDGWYKESTCTNAWNFHSEKVIEETVLYAKWLRLFTVTFRAPEAGIDAIIRQVPLGYALTDIPNVPLIPGKVGVWNRATFTDIRANIVVDAIYTDATYTVGFYDYGKSGNEIELALFTNVAYGENLSITRGDRIAEIETILRQTPNRDNYHFIGWRNTFDNITADLKIYADYERDSHVISFDSQGGNGILPITLFYGDLVSQPEAPQKDGYEFDGWFKGLDFTEVWDFSNDRVLEDRTLFAKWTKLYTITFNYEDGTLYEIITIREDTAKEDIPLPPVPVKTGHTGIWNNTFENIESDFSVMPIYTVISYIVRFINGNEIIPVNGYDEQSVPYGGDAVLPSAVPYRVGHTFSNWESDGKNIVANTDINAVFTINSYTVSFETFVYDISVQPATVQHGNPLSVVPTPQTRVGYDFDGWFKDRELNHQWNNATDTVSQPMTLYAKWTEKHTVQFRYRENPADSEAELVTTSIQVRNGEFISDIPEIPSVAGINAVWKLGNNTFNFENTPINAAITLIAEYTFAVYSVVFSFGDPTLNVTVMVQYGANMPTVPDKTPEQIGHTFVGWRNYYAGAVVTDNVTFYPDFEINRYTVRFINAFDNNHPVILKTQTVDYGSSASGPDSNPSVEGHDFIGWDRSLDNIIGDTDIYARFLVKTINYRFVGDNNLTLASGTVEYGSSLTYNGQEPQRTGYSFAGWDINDDEKRDDENGTIASIRTDVTITALFAINYYIITFDSQGGTPVDSYEGKYNSKLPKPTDPTYANQAFLGWYLDSSCTEINRYDFDSPITSSFRLYAKWESYIEGSSTVTYRLNSAGTAYAVTGSTDNTITALSIANFYSEEGGESKPVTSIAADAFKDFINLTAVELPGSLTEIGANAFRGCYKLSSVSTSNMQSSGFPDALVNIGPSAFSGCSALRSISFNPATSKLSVIGSDAFADCVLLNAFVFPESEDIIVGDRAFLNCTSLTAVNIPNNVREIGAKAFGGTSKLRYAMFEAEYPLTLASDAFEGRADSFRIYVPSPETYVPSGSTITGGWVTYRNAVHSLKNISLDGNWAYEIIQSGANSGKLRIIQYLGNSQTPAVNSTILDAGSLSLDVAELGDFAFDNTITELSLNSAFIITANTLSAASSLESINVTIESGVMNLNTAYIKSAFENIDSLSALSMSAEMTLMAFFGNTTPPTSLTKVTVLNDRNILPDNMFANCASVKEIILPAQLTNIGINAFYNATALEKVTFLGNSLTTIGARAFYNAKVLGTSNGDKGLSVPSSVVNIGNEAFDNTLFINQLKEESDFAILGDSILYKYYGTDTVVNVPAGVKAINAYGFYQNSYVRTVNAINSAVSYVGEYAFSGCVSLEHIVLPATVTSIRANAFNGASKLVKAIIPSLTNAPGVESGAFAGVHSEFSIYVMSSILTLYYNSADWNFINNSRKLAYDSFYYTEEWIAGESNSEGTLIQYIGRNTDVVLPNTIAVNGKSLRISNVANYALVRYTDTSNNTAIESLTVSANQVLSDKSLAGMTELRSLNVLNSAAIINNNKEYIYRLFTDNSKLTNLTVSGDLPIKDLFGSNSVPSALNRVTIDDNSTTLADYMFADCGNINEIILPQNLALDGVGLAALEGSGYVNNYSGDFVIIDTAGGKLIASYKGGESIVRLPSDESVVAVNRGVFMNNDSIEIVFSESNIKHIYERAFYNASSFIKLIMGSSTAPSVGSDVFTNIASGAELFVPTGAVAAYGSFAGFAEISDTEIITIDDYYLSELNGSYTFLQYVGNDRIAAIPNEINGKPVTSVGRNVFLKEVRDITLSVNIPLNESSLTNLRNLEVLRVGETAGSVHGNNAEILKSALTLNDNLNTIGFHGDITLKELLGVSAIPSKITSIEINDGAELLAENMLDGAFSVSSVIIPSSIVNAGLNALEDTAWFNTNSENARFVIIAGRILYKYKSRTAVVNIPAYVEIVNSYAFWVKDPNSGTWSGNNSIDTIRFESGSVATEIREEAFKGAQSLNWINLPDTMNYIAENAFDGTRIAANSPADMLIATGTTTATLVKYTGNSNVVEIPANVTVISAFAFKNTAVTSVTFAQGSALTSVKEGAFDGTALASFAMPSSLRYIGKNAFNGTPYINSFSGEDIIVSGRYLLYNGNGSEARVPSGISYISSAAFDSKDVTTVLILDTIPILYANIAGAFDNVRSIIVPAESYDAYLAAWAAYADKIVKAA